MEEILSLEHREKREFTSPSISWLGLVISGDVTGSGDYQEIVWAIDDERQKAVVISSPASVTCRSHRAEIAWFKDYDVSTEVHGVDFAVGQPIPIGLTEVSLLQLRPGEPAEEFESEVKMEGFVLKGEIHVDAQIYKSPRGGPIQHQEYREGQNFDFDGKVRLKLSCQGQHEAVVFLIWETENPLAEISPS
jgi:hypothetical protein